MAKLIVNLFSALPGNNLPKFLQSKNLSGRISDQSREEVENMNTKVRRQARGVFS